MVSLCSPFNKGKSVVNGIHEIEAVTAGIFAQRPRPGFH